MHEGQMDTTSVKCLINSISRFLHLVSCQTTKSTPIQKNCCIIVGTLQHLKPLLDEVVDYKISSDEYLDKECEGLDMIVNEAREFVENYCPKMSKIHSVLQSGKLIMEVQTFSLEIYRILCRSLQSRLSNSFLTRVQHCMQELQCLKPEPVTIYVEEALRSQLENSEPCSDLLMKIIGSLSLTSNQELLKESIAVEKEWLNAEVNKDKVELVKINRILDLLSSIHDCMMKFPCEGQNGIFVPPYFRCPLSLELMLDPVIVASGQTYDRYSIQKWFDHGLTICPKTRQKLTHANLIPNYTVKAMIANWCEENNVKLLNAKFSNSVSVTSPPDHLVPQDLIRTYSFQSSLNSNNSTPRSSLQGGNGFEKQKGDVSFRLSGKCTGCHSREAEKFELPSPAPSYIHSRSESVSSSISSADYIHPALNEGSRICCKHGKVNMLSGEITSKNPASCPRNKESGISPGLTGKQFPSPPKKVDGLVNGNNNHPRACSLPLSDSGFDELTTTLHVNRLIEDLNSQSNELQTMAAEELRLLAKHNMENRIIIGQCGAIVLLLSLLYSDVKLTQEHAVTALLNLSIYEDNKTKIAEAGAIEPLIHVLKTGNDGAKENSAAALFSLSVLEKYKARIGCSGAVKALVDLLGSGTIRGKKDAATALFNLSIFHDNKARIVQAGAVKYLVPLMEPSIGMVDKSVALLANLSTIGEGRLAVVQEGGIPLLVEIVESGSLRGKENAASILLQLCLHSPKFCNLVLQEGAVPPSGCIISIRHT
ncbi:RING-type E3 ubiquitin transferase [Quillaja saponaria]|uniref:RING-type E3 ubiquitin transferase n=1 Tax=Quillaja saponaria TaxID=32244 RepID=A0AAD7Q0N9_QUISA|nr:RING-type E3 ubiquitin transferase [Quillaja saponaria]